MRGRALCGGCGLLRDPRLGRSLALPVRCVALGVRSLSATIRFMSEPSSSLRAPVAIPVQPGSATADFVDEAQHALFDFHGVSSKNAVNVRLKKAVNKATLHQYTQRQAVMPDLPDANALRTLAGEIKQHTIENLDYYLEQLKTNVERNGGQVHFAATANHKHPYHCRAE